MSDETATGSARAPDGGGHPQSGGGDGSPLQTRAAFVKNWNWQSVVSINQGACARGRAQHGINSETESSCAEEWEALRSQVLTLEVTLDRLRGFHRKAPFLFFNGNTFATIGREMGFALFSELVPVRKREVGSAMAHYIAGVLSREAIVEVVEGLCDSAQFNPGDRVKTLRGSARGVIVRLLSDGRVAWRPDGTQSELIRQTNSLLSTIPEYSMVNSISGCMGMTSRNFRLLLTWSWIVMIAAAALDLATESTLPEALREFFQSQYNEELGGEDWLLLVLCVLFLSAVVASYAGLYNFKRWGRTLWLWTGIAGCILMPALGPAVNSGWAESLYFLATAMYGAILAVIYVSPVAAIIEGQFDAATDRESAKEVGKAHSAQQPPPLSKPFDERRDDD